MSKIPADLKYTEEHEWAKQEGDLVVVGITDYAQDSLGDIVYVEMEPVGEMVEQSTPFGVVESVKAASDLFAPIPGEIVEVNARLQDEPELLNSDPYNEAWLVKINPTDGSEWEQLLDAAGYAELLESDG